MLDISNNMGGWNGQPTPNRCELIKKLAKMKTILVNGHNISVDVDGQIVPVLTQEQLKAHIQSPKIIHLTISNIVQTSALEGAGKMINEILPELMSLWPNQHIDLLQTFLKEFHIHRCG